MRRISRRDSLNGFTISPRPMGGVRTPASSNKHDCSAAEEVYRTNTTPPPLSGSPPFEGDHSNTRGAGASRLPGCTSAEPQPPSLETLGGGGGSTREKTPHARGINIHERHFPLRPPLRLKMGVLVGVPVRVLNQARVLLSLRDCRLQPPGRGRPRGRQPEPAACCLHCSPSPPPPPPHVLIAPLCALTSSMK